MASLNYSIFDIPETLEELNRPSDILKVRTIKVIPTTNSIKGNFGGQNIIFDWQLSSNQWWLASRSFLAIRDSIYFGKNDGADDNQPTQPTDDEDVATSFNSVENLFDGYQLTIGGFSLGSKEIYAPQISAVNKRLMKSKSHLNSVQLDTACFEPDFRYRKQQIISDGLIPSRGGGDTISEDLSGTITVAAGNSTFVGVNTLFTTELIVGDKILTAGGQALHIKSIADDTNATITSSENAGEAGATYSKFQPGVEPSNRANKNEWLFQPCLGAFSSPKALPPCRYELICRSKPDITYKKSVLSSELADLDVKAGERDEEKKLDNDEYEYLVDDFVFYLAVVEADEMPPRKATYVYDYDETEAVKTPISGGSLVTENYTISKSSTAVTIGLQDHRAGINTLYSPSIFRVEGDHQNNLSSLQIDYAGQARPQPPSKGNLEADVPARRGLKDYTTRLWNESSVEDLSYYDTGGTLTKNEAKKIGYLNHFQWKKSGDDISTNLDVSVQYPVFEGGAQNNLFVFHHFRRVNQFTIENNEVINFLSQDA